MRLLCILLLAGFCWAQQPAQQADAAYQAKDWATAVQLYSKLASDDPQQPQPHYRLGVSLNGLGRYEEAIPQFETWLKLMPEKSPARAYGKYGLAVSHAGLKQDEQALALLQEAIAGGYAPAQPLEEEAAFAGLRGKAEFAALVEQAKHAAAPCEYEPEYRAFDFWIGSWEVFNQQGTKQGENTILSINKGCTLLENWTSVTGGTGKSFNIYNSQTKKWQQFWVDAGGDVLDLNNGQASEGKMVFLGKNYPKNGAIQDYRLTFTKMGDKVRQVGESSSDGGKTWQVGYDFIYVKKGQ